MAEDYTAKNTEKPAQSFCDQVVKTFLDHLATIKGFEEIAGNLEVAILNKRPTETSIRSALFDEEAS